MSSEIIDKYKNKHSRIDLYIQYVNNFTSIKDFAKFYEINIMHAHNLVTEFQNLEK